MEFIYKVIISGKGIYEEIDLKPGTGLFTYGTQPQCDARVHRDMVFADFIVYFHEQEDTWAIECSDALYLYLGDVRKVRYHVLSKGDEIEIRYDISDSIAFTIQFLLNFEYVVKKLQRQIDPGQKAAFSIGGNIDTGVLLTSPYTETDLIQLSKTGDGYGVKVINSAFGAYINGNIIDRQGQLGNKDFLAIGDTLFCYDPPFFWTEIRNDIIPVNLSWMDHAVKPEYPGFVRNVRVKQVLNTEEIEILDPPNRPEKPKNNLFLSLLPSMGMLVASGLMASMGGSMMVYSLLSGGMAIVTSVASLISNNKDYKKDLEKRIEVYRHYAAEKRKEIEEERNKELLQLDAIYIDQEKEQELLEQFSDDLFDRHTGDADFLHVRLGTGVIESLRKINYKKQERLEIEDDLQLIPETIAKESRNVGNAPVVCDLKAAGAVAVIGDLECRYAMLKNLVFDLCIRHFPDEAEFFFVAEPCHADQILTYRFLPHVRSEETGLRNIACEDAGRNRLFDRLYKELSVREKDQDAKQLVIFLFDEYGIMNHPVSRFIEQAKELSATFLFFTDRKGKAPLGCTQLIFVDSMGNGRLISSDDAKSVFFEYKPIDDLVIDTMVSRLAPVYVEEVSLESELIKNISFFQLLHIFSVTDLDLAARWGQSNVTKSMAAPIGVTKHEMISLDLHDKAHGPHGLVAGTTGSGKSELLQTYILSAATLFHPYEVGFVIIDFKGGGMVNQFRSLPHLLGAITNIDGKEIDRSLKSIKAELQKRQHLFAEADVNHIDKYIQKYKAGKAGEPLPHLILIVDEFAELKAEQPDFMAELISAARIGRSLGVHLILATQKPSGQVDDQIWSNSRFKLCLKVQDASDSNEVLKSPLAAEIKEAGRAYLQVGNNEIFELFQSAYSGAPEREDTGNAKEFDIYCVEPSGVRTMVYSQKKGKLQDAGRNQLDAVVAYIQQYCEEQQIAKLPDICLPSLPDEIFYPDSQQSNSPMIDIGIYDDPDNQIQEPAWMDLDSRHTFILGSSQYGKTNLLQSMIRSIAKTGTPAQHVIYILDFGSMVLKTFESLQHVGGIVTSSEDEKLKNLFKLLLAEIQNRKAQLVEAGVSSHAAYTEAGYTDLPHIYLLIDNLTALIELYLEDDDSLLGILREGLSVGITAVIANSQTSGVSFRYLANFANRICFFCNDGSEYMNLFDRSYLQPDEKPGRCVLEIDKRQLECQTYLAFAGEREIDRVQAIRDFIYSVNAQSGNLHARKIPSIPELLEQKIMHSDFGAETSSYRIPVGLTYQDVEPYYLDFAQLGIFGVSGKEDTGHSNFVHYLLDELYSVSGKYPVRVFVFDDIRRKYADLKEHPLVENYMVSIEDAGSVIGSWHQILAQRYEQVAESGLLDEDQELLLMIIQNNDLARKIEDDLDMQEQMNDILDRFRGMRAAILLADFPNTSLSYDAPELLRRVKEEQHLLFLEDLDNLKPFDVPYDALRANRKKLGKGDAYYIHENDVVKLKIVKAEK